jgi:hypothetical protein
VLFRSGVSTLIAPLRLTQSIPSAADLEKFAGLSVSDWVRGVAQEVANMQLYDHFYNEGWTTTLGRRVRRELAPALVRTVTIMWYGAVAEARGAK